MRPDAPARPAGLPSGIAYIDLYWLPLGAGGHCVRLNGRIFEAAVARREHRRPCDLYHSALLLASEDTTFAIEMAPVWNERSPGRGVVAEGPVGSRIVGHLRAFRYEIRCWPGGRIPDSEEAVESPRRLSTDPALARSVLMLVHDVPTAIWGRDELGAGEMWNSNSLTSWLLVRAGMDLADVRPPAGGRAPGWDAGVTIARRTVAAARA